MNEKEIKESKDEELESVSGGFSGNDWNATDMYLYRKAGIKHVRHALRRDEYFDSATGEKISRDEAKARKNEMVADTAVDLAKEAGKAIKNFFTK